MVELDKIIVEVYYGETLNQIRNIPNKAAKGAILQNPQGIKNTVEQGGNYPKEAQECHLFRSV